MMDPSASITAKKIQMLFNNNLNSFELVILSPQQPITLHKTVVILQTQMHTSCAGYVGVGDDQVAGTCFQLLHVPKLLCHLPVTSSSAC